MSAPYFTNGLFDVNFSLLIALLIGIGFGFFLEWGGLGSAKKLAGQFYFKDFTVFKVMFSAIVTAMIGLYWLSYFEILDLPSIYVNPTYVYPQLIGGILFGIGFVVGGLCPGTSCVSISNGKIDGVALLAGIFGGIFIFSETEPLFSGFYMSGGLGAITLPEIFNVADGVAVFIISLLAILGFYGSGRLLQKLNPGISTPKNDEKKLNKKLAAFALSITFLAFLSGNSIQVEPYPTWAYKNELNKGSEFNFISAHGLAELIQGRNEEFVLVDIRSREDYNKYHIPGAIHHSEITSELFNRQIKLIYYNYDDEIPEFYRLNKSQALFLYNGIEEWFDKIIFPDFFRLDADEKLERKIINRSRFFGGNPRTKNDQTNKSSKYREGC